MDDGRNKKKGGGGNIYMHDYGLYRDPLMKWERKSRANWNLKGLKKEMGDEGDVQLHVGHIGLSDQADVKRK